MNREKTMRINTMEILYLYYAMAGKLLNFDIVDKKTATGLIAWDSTNNNLLRNVVNNYQPTTIIVVIKPRHIYKQ